MGIPSLPSSASGVAWPTLALTKVQKEAITNGQLRSALPPQGVVRLTNQATMPVVLPVGVATPSAQQSRPSFEWAPLKGIILGTIVYGLLIGFVFPRVFWLSDWHWVWLLTASVAGTVLIGSGRVLIVLTLLGLWLGRAEMLQHPWLALACIGGGVVIRLLYGWLP